MAVSIGASIASYEGSLYGMARATLATNLSAAYSQSPFHYEQLPTHATREEAHQSWAVKVDGTENQNTVGKQKGSRLAPIKSTVSVRMLFQLDAEDVDAAYEAALLMPTVIRNALIDEATGQAWTSAGGTAFTGSPQTWRWIRSTNRLVGEGTHVLLELTFTVWHQVAQFNF